MAEPLTTTAVTAAFAAGAAKKAGEIAFGALMERLVTLLPSERDSKVSKEIEISLSKYERQTFERCIKVKTLISRGQPVDLLSIYVPVRFKYDNKEVDQFKLIDEIPRLRNIAISGTGGSGKSMFMRYLWLALFERNHGRIPVFLELRNYNEISIDDFNVFLFNSIFSGAENLDGMKIFNRMLEQGKFSFVFDGFDEVSEDKKHSISKQIISMSNRFPDNFYIISTRPHDHISHWPNFSTFSVSPMRKSDVISLVNKLEFSPKVKAKFLLAIKESLFETHRTFLEIPLLVTIMLLLFDDIADIPNDMHVFYEHAFWTLFRRHDASKEAFDRKLNCGLSMDQFRSAVSAFCFFSYIGNRPHLNENEISSYVQQTSKFLAISISSDSFKKDLVNNVCFLQADGLDYSFIHRSFQEYFSAAFIADRPEEEWLEAAPILPNSSTESALSILYSMNSDKFDSAIMNTIINKLSLKEFSGSELLSRIIEFEGNTPQAILITDNTSRKIHNRTAILFFSMFGSKIYRLNNYYINRCRYSKSLSVSPSMTFRIGKSGSLFYDIVKSHLKDKDKISNDSYSRSIDTDIFIGAFSSIDEFKVTISSDYTGKHSNSDISRTIFESDPYRTLVHNLGTIAQVLQEISRERSQKRPFSELIGRQPIFL